MTEKDLRRQLRREQDRSHALDEKYRECRNENDKLRVVVGTKSHDVGVWDELRDSVADKQVKTQTTTSHDVSHIYVTISNL